MGSYLGCNLVGEIESLKIINNINLFCSRPNLLHNNKNWRNEKLVPCLAFNTCNSIKQML